MARNKMLKETPHYQVYNVKLLSSVLESFEHTM